MQLPFPSYLEIHAHDVFLFVLCCLTAIAYKVSNPYLEVEHDLYENNRMWYYVFKYSRIVVFGILFFTVYMAVIRGMKYHANRMAADLKV